MKFLFKVLYNLTTGALAASLLHSVFPSLAWWPCLSLIAVVRLAAMTASDGEE